MIPLPRAFRPRRLPRIHRPAPLASALLAPAALAVAAVLVAAVPAAALDPAAAELLGRRAAAVHEAVSGVWRRDFRLRFGLSYAAPALVKFAGARPSPCAGTGLISGLSYCPIDRTLSVDLVFLAAAAEQPGLAGDRALALLLARASAPHVQAELAILGDVGRRRGGRAASDDPALDAALVLQADCFTGVWARRAERTIGRVPEGSWGALVTRLRAEAPEAARQGRLDLAPVPERENAFGRGYAEGALRDCLGPGIAGRLG